MLLKGFTKSVQWDTTHSFDAVCFCHLILTKFSPYNLTLNPYEKQNCIPGLNLCYEITLRYIRRQMFSFVTLFKKFNKEISSRLLYHTSLSFVQRNGTMTPNIIQYFNFTLNFTQSFLNKHCKHSPMTQKKKKKEKVKRRKYVPLFHTAQETQSEYVNDKYVQRLGTTKWNLIRWWNQNFEF